MPEATAVVCEFNPIHPGHRHLLKLAKTAGELVICVMSGHFTERGIPALFEKYARAEAAVLCGADLVVELPFPWSASGAEDFARGGCAVAANLGAGSMTFGSESGDLRMLTEGAAVRGSEEFALRMREAERKDRRGGSAALFDAVMREEGIALAGGNDRLGIEYIRFGAGSGIREFRPVRRLASAPSAAEIREKYARGGFAAAEPEMAEEAVPVLRDAVACGEDRFEELLFAHARLYIREDVRNDLLRYAAKTARGCLSAEEFTEKLPTKKYTAARMKRELLRSVLPAGDASREPRFTVLLAANAAGRAYLAALRKDAAIPVIVKPADYSGLGEEGKRQYAAHCAADDLYAYLTGMAAGEWMKRGARMV